MPWVRAARLDNINYDADGPSYKLFRTPCRGPARDQPAGSRDSSLGCPFYRCCYYYYCCWWCCLSASRFFLHSDNRKVMLERRWPSLFISRALFIASIKDFFLNYEYYSSLVWEEYERFFSFIIMWRRSCESGLVLLKVFLNKIRLNLKTFKLKNPVMDRKYLNDLKINLVRVFKYSNLYSKLYFFFIFDLNKLLVY